MTDLILLYPELENVQVLHSWISAVIGAVGGLVGGYLANKNSSDEAEENRDFQEDMSNTAYARGIEDMKSAGINPILAYKQGGASTPGGSTASQIDPITPAINTALSARQKTAELKNITTTNEILEKQKDIAHWDANVARYKAVAANLHNVAVLPHQIIAEKKQQQNLFKQYQRDEIILDYENAHPSLLKTERVLRPVTTGANSASNVLKLIPKLMKK